MIGTTVYVSLGMSLFFGVLIPLAAALWWIKTQKENVTTVLLGAATWFFFAMILESLPKAFLFNAALPIGKLVMENAALYTVLGALMAGIFEETGRFVVFKTLLRRRTNRETAVSHGIGHGGMEALFALFVGGIQNIVYAELIQTGKFQAILDQVAATGADVSALQTLPRQIMEITPGTVCLSAAERVFAMLLHVGLSILVFYAVKKAKPQLYILSVLLHALFDVPAALYQCGVIRSVYVCEAAIAACAVVFFVGIYTALYQKDTAQPVEQAENIVCEEDNI